MKLTLENKKGLTGWFFIAPWFFGLIFFFVKPMVLTILYSVEKIFINDKGFTTKFVGLENYHKAFFVDPNFIRKLIQSFQNMAFEVPIILLFSLFIAVILNQKFKGRMIARALFFLPVIIASGVVIQLLKDDVLAKSIGSNETVYMFKSSGIQDLLQKSGIDSRIVNYFTGVINRIFDMTWKAGVQILMFLGALQTIPKSMYEASSIEGATAWETFWKITFPMISPMILVNIVYTIIDSFTDYRNVVMTSIVSAGTNMQFEYASAMAMVYMICIVMVLGVVMKLISKNIFYTVE